jgi:hypothetical protein
LTATLSAGSFASGSGTLTYTITGTPTSSGTASFALNIGGQTATLTRTVVPSSIISLDASSLRTTGAQFNGYQVSGSSYVSYTGGNGGSHNGQTVSSTGVTGLTATLSAGNFAAGDGTLIYTLTGSPSGIGTASFSLNIGGQTATLAVQVATLAVGQPYQGGRILYINPGTTTGFIAALSDQGRPDSWGQAFTFASNHRGGGYTDWFLPNRSLLAEISNFRYDWGYSTSSYYWSSEAASSSTAYNRWFGGSYSGTYENSAYMNDGNNYVIAVRAF